MALASMGVAVALWLQAGLVLDRRYGGDHSRDVAAVDPLPLRQFLDRVGVANGVANPHSGHPMGLRERSRHDQARVLQGRRYLAAMRGVGDVVVVGLVD